MSYALPNGSAVYLAAEYGEEIPFTAISNADNASLTVNGETGISAGDIVLITSSWSGIDNVVARVLSASSSNVVLENVSTSDTKRYPAGGGAGSIKKVNSWVEIPQITEVASAGGEQNTVQIQFLSDDIQRNLNTYKSARSQTYTIAHDSTLPLYDLLRSADYNGDTLAVYMYVPKAKETRYWSGTVSFNDTVTTAINQLETVSVVINIQSPAITFYKDAAITPGS